jgi:hypothetical protein
VLGKERMGNGDGCEVVQTGKCLESVSIHDR